MLATTETREEKPISEVIIEEPSTSEESVDQEVVVDEPVAEELAITKPAAVEVDADEPEVDVAVEVKEPTAADSLINVDDAGVVDAEVGDESTATEDIGTVEHSPVIATAELLIVEKPVAEEPGAEKLAVEEPVAAEAEVEAPVVLAESVPSLEPATNEPAASGVVDKPVVQELIAQNPLEKEITAIPNQSPSTEVDAAPKKPTWKPEKWVDDKESKTM